MGATSVATGQTRSSGHAAQVGAALLAQNLPQSPPTTAPRMLAPAWSSSSSGVTAVAAKVRWWVVNVIDPSSSYAPAARRGHRGARPSAPGWPRYSAGGDPAIH